MSERFKAEANENASKNTRLPIAEEFSHYRFGRDALAHVSRYLWVVERWIDHAKRLKRPLTILDIGCGDAYTARVFASSFRVKKDDIVDCYYGFDIDNVSLGRTRKTMPAKPEWELVLGDVTTGGLDQFSDRQFDIVVCMEMIEHIQPRFVAPFLRDVKRIGRHAYISTPNFTGGSGKLPEDHIKEWDTDELCQLMTAQGINVQRRIGIFSNLNKVQAIAKENAQVAGLYAYLEPLLDGHFLSLVMARFIGTAAQNVMYDCVL